MYPQNIHKGFLLIAFMTLAGWFISAANADYWVAYDEDYDYDYFRSDKLSREHRDAGDVDDWLERGNSTITESKRFPDGIRVAAWASDSENDEEFDFAIASAIYLFEVPRRAQYIEIKVRYKGEGRESEFDDFEEIAGRVWVRNLEKERRQRRNDDDEQETQYGDTFLLRAKRRSETIKIPAVHHVDRDGFMEVHIVADGDQLLDVEYIDVASYRRQPKIRVIHKYLPTHRYRWRPWHHYTYVYFYDGPSYYSTDYGFYIRWRYPVFSRNYVVVRANYSKYLGRYYRRYPHYTRRNVNVRAYRHNPERTRTRRHLNAWTKQHEKVRKVYDRSKLTKKKSANTGIRQVRAQVRTTIQKTRTAPVLSNRVIKTRSERIKRRRGDTTSSPQNQPRSSIMKRRRGKSQPERSVRITQPEEDKTERDIRSKSRSRTSESKSTRSRILDAIKKRRSKSSQKTSSSVNSSPAKKQDTSKKEKDDDDDDDDEDDDEEEKKKEENRKNRTKRRR